MNDATQFFDTTAGGGYEIERSLRFNSSDSAYLSRTPASAGNRKTWTWAGWVKRSALGSTQVVFSAFSGGGSNYFLFQFTSADLLQVFLGPSVGQLVTTAVYRDVSAWYHIVLAYDTTQATTSNRIKLYVNGVQVTAFNIETYPSLDNASNYVNSTVIHYLSGSYSAPVADLFNGYLADVHFIDGQALDPSSFTEFDDNGVLQPKAYAGSYGTNGFHLPFSDNSSAAALGTDTSGNSNNWTPNNFSVVSGTGVVTTPASNAPPTVDFLVVAGGGGGGLDLGGGGGGGGLRSSVTATGGGGTLESPLAVVAGATYSVSVGGGGAGATAHASTGSKGGDSTFSTVTATGGGGGKSRSSGTGNSAGGSGGGGSFNNGTAGTGTANQGFNGGTASGYGCGGGGGAGSLGSNTTGNQGGNGGSGVSSSITGSSVAYAGGGGGGSIDGATVGSGQAGGSNGTSAGGATPSSGTANTGGGGGGQGGTTNVGASGAGGAGGSGIVIIRYANTYDDLIVGGGLTYTYANTGGYKIYSFTASPTAAQAAGNDSLVDSPTNYGTDAGAGGEVRGNYATLNPLDKGAGVTLSNGNLDGSASSDANYRATISINSGKHYWEVSNFNTAASSTYGILEANLPVTTLNLGEILYRTDGLIITGGSSIGSYASLSSGDILGIACNFDAGEITFYKNNSLQATVSFTSNMTTYGVTPFGRWNNGSGATYNFGQRAFAYPAPSGFKSLCTTNLEPPTIADGSTAMDVALYTGNGSTQTISGLNFSPDLVWLKNRGNGASHRLTDIVRGATLSLFSDSTTAELTEPGSLTSFTSDGFTLGSGGGVNNPGTAAVAWTWDAGSSTVTNTQGSISSQVRANVSAGFSVVTFTSPSSGTFTVGHGLGVSPSLIILKDRGQSSSWSVYHSTVTSKDEYLLLNTTAAKGSNTDYWGTTAPSSTVFGANAGVSVQTSDPCVAYCFAPVDGYSSFGSYTGNGSADGPFVYTGFRPRWILAKASSISGQEWFIHDTARDPSNVAGFRLTAEGSFAENVTNNNWFDILSNGFKYRTSNGAANGSGTTYIYAAFAESPFQYARAR